MTQHHLGRENQRARVDLVLAGILRRGTVGRFEHRHGVGQVGARRDADTAHFRGQGVRQIVAVEVKRSDHIVLGRAQQDLLEHGVGDGVLDHNVLAGFRVLELHPRAAIEQGRAELFRRYLVGPFLEGTFGELHDVAFVHDGQRVAVIVDHVLQGLARQALGAFAGYRLDADAAVFVETDLGDAHFFFKELDDLGGFRRTGLPLDASVDVFGVLAEDGHVDVARLFHRARHAFEPTHRAQADVQVELLTQGHVQRADTATDRSGQRAFDGDHVILDRVEGFLGQPGVLIINLGGFFPGVDFHPGDLALAAVGLFNSSIDNLDHHRTDVDTNTVTFDEGNDRVIRNIERMVCIDGDFVADGWNLNLLVTHAELHCLD